MSILRGLERRGADPTLPWGSSYIPTNGQIGLVAAGVPMNDDAAMSITTVATCVAILADDVSTLPLNTYKKGGNTKKLITPAPPLIADPWPEGIQQDWLTQCMYSISLRGNIYGRWLGRDDRGYPTMCQIVHPDSVFARRDGQTGQRIYRFNGQPIPTEDVLHIPSALLPPGGFIGLNPVEYARGSWALASASEKYGGQFFANSAMPSGVISTAEDLSPEETLEMARDWKQSHGGIGNAQYPAVLTGGATWQQITMTMDDAQFLQTRDFQRHEIATWFRIPEHRLGFQDRTSSWGTGIEQMEIGYVIGTLRPYLNRIETYLSRQLPPNQECKFDLRGRLRGDTGQRFAAYMLAFQNGWMNLDEIRELEDLPPLPDGLGQVHYGPLNFAPLGTPRGPQPAGGPTAGQGVGGQTGGVDETPVLDQGITPAAGGQFNKQAEELILRTLEAAGHSV